MSQDDDKVRQEFTRGDLVDFSAIRLLDDCRNELYDLGLIGQDPGRYDGDGYGNVSQRIGDRNLPLNERAFTITGTKTGGIERLGVDHYTTVRSYHPMENRFVSEGPMEASSESMTHGAIYDQDLPGTDSTNAISFAFHCHSPEIWNAARRLEIPVTDHSVKYGTSQMALEVVRLFRDTDVRDKKIFAMGGHTDGVFSFGNTAHEALSWMKFYLERAG